MNSRGVCRNSPDSFCYVFGYYISTKQKKHNIRPGTKYFTAHNVYIEVPIRDQDNSWAPHVCCGSCNTTLEGWLRGFRKFMPFAVSRFWREPTNHHDNCYFCMVDVSSLKNLKQRGRLQYPDISSSIAPIPHGQDLSALEPPAVHSNEFVSPYTRPRK
ncbi:hypothetical protein ANN_27967 [Periplaneta americana]|uniref:Uncharacterized protein n=1 Tax=Periplaneta americana TaxID=6978 RepID=A0ABQ8RUG8_PERAM|nr:hypothetical protein ANN_27967 [Periplaneta americana]